MSRRNLYTQVLLLVCVLAVFGLLFGGSAATQAQIPAERTGPRGPMPEILKYMPEDMKLHHDRYDNRLTAIYEQWLAGRYVEQRAGISGQSGIAAAAGPFSPLFGDDVRMSSTAFAGSQNEFQIDINPTNSQFSIGASNDGRTAGVGIYRTSDSGATWTPFDAPIATSACCDPAVSYAYDGAVYVGVLDTSPSGVHTIRSTDNGVTWGAPSFVVAADRNQMVVDNGPTSPHRGAVYISYSDLAAGGSNRIKGYKSTDNGATWGSTFFIGRDAAGTYQQSNQIRAASDGTVYVGYQHYIASNQAQTWNMLAKSTDGGSTFNNYTITSQLIVQAGIENGRMYLCTATSTGTSQNFRHRGHPILGMHPTNPNIVYASWTDGRFEAADYTCPSIVGRTGVYADIVFSKSTDGGVTWADPAKVNQDTAQRKDQYFPWMDVAPDGTIWVGWNDRRDDPNNVLSRWYAAYSTDGGATWTESPVADVQTRPTTFIGDYMGLAAENDLVLGMWWDNRSTSNGDPYTDPHRPAPVITATPTNTNTPMPTDTPTTTPTNTPTATGTATQCVMNFSDVMQGDYFYDAVRYMFCNGIISGYQDGTFRPYNDTTRGQLCKIVVLAMGWPLLNPPTPTFNDVAVGSTFYQFVETAYAEGIISGYECGTDCLEFRPNNNVTRGQLSKIVVLAMEWPLLDPKVARFTDVARGSTFYTFVETAAFHGIISGYGDNTFRPGNNATRGQISVIVYRAIKGPSPTSTPMATATPVQVNISSFAFVPQTITITVGSSVRWTNLDAVQHNSASTANPPVWTAPLLNQDESYTFTFTTAGSYSYICTPHPSMTGTVVVTGGVRP